MNHKRVPRQSGLWRLPFRLLGTMDRSSYFTCPQYTQILLDKAVKISMDGTGQAFENIFTERLWCSVNCKEVYLHDYETPPDARQGLDRYFTFYNDESTAPIARLPHALLLVSRDSVRFGDALGSLCGCDSRMAPFLVTILFPPWARTIRSAGAHIWHP